MRQAEERAPRAARMLQTQIPQKNYCVLGTIYGVIVVIAMSGITTLDQCVKKDASFQFESLSENEKRRLMMKRYKEWLLVISDQKLTPDADLQRLMETGFASSIGPYMRALFPPEVTNSLQQLLPVIEPQYRASLDPQEEAAAIATSMLPPSLDNRLWYP